MNEFRPGSWTLYPRAEYLAQATDADDLRRRFAEGNRLIERLQEIEQQLRQAARKQRNAELRLHRLAKVARGDGFRFWQSQEERDAEAQMPEVEEEVDSATNEVHGFLQEWESTSRFLARNFIPLRTAAGELDLTPPDVEAIKDEVGQPVRGWPA